MTVSGNVTGAWSQPGVYYIAQMLHLSHDKIYIDDKLTGTGILYGKNSKFLIILILTRFY